MQPLVQSAAWSGKVTTSSKPEEKFLEPLSHLIQTQVHSEEIYALMLAEILFMDLMQLNQPIRKLLFGSNQKSSSFMETMASHGFTKIQANEITSTIQYFN